MREIASTQHDAIVAIIILYHIYHKVLSRFTAQCYFGSGSKPPLDVGQIPEV